MFIEREEFYQDMRPVRGVKYVDIEAVYGELNRTVIVLLATSTPAEIRDLFNRLGFPGDPYSHALHEWAQRCLTILQRRARNGRRAA